eukprot:CAMPEP_0173455798 /NCGR_PEP_ID=MMETSP1357-20121228/54894_1 /TAXON_ID=77926 /ORGANISM="Hemiselmis rufescens, Strain PCC563" /LENGTH=56 /DNA_ID=CAMNT_0014422957 /DNA_START=94 /DNA_END=260 /DNA_ORIENTATION=+
MPVAGCCAGAVLVGRTWCVSAAPIQRRDPLVSGYEARYPDPRAPWCRSSCPPLGSS